MLDLKKENEKREEFRNILFELSESYDKIKKPADRAKIYGRLEKLYASEGEDEFRHFYSDIFSVLTQVQQQDKPGDIAILGENLRIVRAGYQAKNKDENGKLIDITNSIRKLYDHVSLDIARIGYSDAADRRLSQEEKISELKSKVESVANSVEKSTKESFETLRTVRNDLSKIQREYIAILGIFASIVLAFTGGLTFSTSVLENINAVSVYRLLAVITLLGLILTDLLYLLMIFICKLIREKASTFLKSFVIINGLFVIILCIIAFCWFKGLREQRNFDMQEKYSQLEYVESN